MREYDYIIRLYDYYSELLTVRQRKYFEDYYFNNYSLSEIADNYNISRNAIYKAIKAVDDKLMLYESKMCLCKKRKRLEEIVKVIDDEDVKNELMNMY